MKRFLIIITILSLLGCNKSITKKDRLLIYSGVTMSQALEEVCKYFERSHNCDIDIIYGGSGIILKKIIYNKQGDLFFPGSYSYIEKLKERDSRSVVDTAFVGVNTLYLMVQKDNPSNIRNLYDLKRDDLKLILGNPETGSVGKATLQLLKLYDLDRFALSKALKLTPDSKDLIYAIKDGDADIVVNWKNSYIRDNNSLFMDLIPIENPIEKELIVAQLSYSNNKLLSNKFINFLRTEKVRKIFVKHGF